MKNRSLVLGAAGLMFAAAAAFTTVSANPFATIAEVKVRFTPGGPVSCLTTNKSCSDIVSGQQCIVSVQTQNGAQNARAYKASCATLMFTDTQPVGTFTNPTIPYEVVQ